MRLAVASLLVALGFAAFVELTQQYVQIQRGEYQHLHFGNYKAFLNHKLNVSHVLDTIIVKDYIECAFGCIINVACFSFNIASIPDINSNRHVCHLLPTDKYNQSQSFISSHNFHHYTMTSPCESFPCKLGGTCHPLYDNDDYFCDCIDGSSGKNCEPVFNNCFDASRTTGIYKILNHGSQTFPVYCDQTSDGGGWTMVFKVVKGVTSPKVGQFWNSNSPTEQTESISAALDTSSSYHGLYKNRIVNNWQSFNPQEVRVVLYENGNEVASMKFNASGTNRVNWFSQKNLVSSPWNDLKNAGNLRHFDITGSGSRFFEISGPYSVCDRDSGWMIITGGSCNWETRSTNPGILYSKLGSAVKWQADAGNVGVADVLAVFIR